MDASEAASRLERIRQDKSLLNVINLEARGKALEELDFIREFCRAQASWKDLRALEKESRSLAAALKQIDEHLFETSREQIRSGRRDPAAVRLAFESFSRYRGRKGSEYLRFDGLDRLVDGILQIDASPKKYKSWRRGLVHYEPAPMSLILELDQSPV